MNSNSPTEGRGARRASWIAAGFIGAFAASIVTVIYTGLMVEGSRSEFDADFRSVTMQVGETRAIELVFDVTDLVESARLELEVPPMLELVEPGVPVTEVSLVPGDNRFEIEVRAVTDARAYLIARLVADQPIALERVFVTVAGD